MTIAPVTAAATAASAKTTHQTLGQADFIRLMTTQMKLQDPLEPVDNKEMIAQMAQFSSLSGIENINSTLKAISAQLDTVLTDRAAGTDPTATAPTATA
jgi:flagellar basal-body rod modification protein FlgD